jgi:hypothetical protein
MTTAPTPDGAHIYRPLPRWQVCTDCGAMWTSHLEGDCWSCGGTGRPTHSPSITSQYGFGTNDVGAPPRDSSRREP